MKMPPSQKINLKDKIDDGEIDLSMCDLQDVPVKDIANTKNIYSLDLSNNHLVTLPKNFATLKFLTKLDLSKNSLKELPENFGDLVKLKHLDLYKNQLQHLPLSFSKLKALKWLDLKDNPLVPLIRETAGLCLDSKQCLTCAKNVVQFYVEFQQKVEAEKEMRETQRQKDLQANELALQKQKQQEKKNKKKEKKQKITGIVARNNGLVEEPIIQENSYVYANLGKPEKKISFCGAILNFIQAVIMHVMLFMLLIFVLTSLKLEVTRELEKKLLGQWSVFVENCPPPYHCYLNDFGSYLRIIHTKTGDSIYIIVHYIRELANEINIDNINYIYKRIINFYYDLFKIAK